MGIAIIIPTCGRPELLQRTLQSLAECPMPKEYRGLWVVENGTPLGVERLCAPFTRALQIRYRYCPRASHSNAMNVALREIGQGWAIFFEDDVVVTRHALVAYQKAFTRYGERYFFGGPLVAEYEKEPGRWLKTFLPASARGLDYGPAERRLWRPYFNGNNWAASVRAVLGVGGFDARFGPGSAQGLNGSEWLLQLKLRWRGYRGVYLPECGVRHWVPKARCSWRWLLRRRATWLTEFTMIPLVAVR